MSGSTHSSLRSFLQTNIAANFPLQNERAVLLSLSLLSCETRRPSVRPSVRRAETLRRPGETCRTSTAQACFLALSGVGLAPANQRPGGRPRHRAPANQRCCARVRASAPTNGRGQRSRPPHGCVGGATGALCPQPEGGVLKCTEVSLCYSFRVQALESDGGSWVVSSF